MGGEGSGRRPDPVKQLIEQRTPIASTGNEGIFIPNYSGLKTGTKKTDSEVYLLNTGDTGTGDYTFDGAVVFNESGADKDFRIEGDTNQNLFFVDASADKIGVGTSSPAKMIHTQSPTASITTANLIENTHTDTTTNDTEGAPYFLSRRTAALILKNTSGSWAFSNWGNDATAGLVGGFRIYNPENNKSPFQMTLPTSYGSTYTTLFFNASAECGVGTTNPTQKLHVYTPTSYQGQLLIGTSAPVFTIQTDSGTLTRLKIGVNSSDQSANIWNVGTGDIVFYTNGGTYATASEEIARFKHSTKALDFYDGRNISFQTTTGTKIATATSQKMGFWNTTPIIQPTTGIAAASFTANTSNIADDTATWDGYTIGQVVKALRNMGLLA